MNDNVIIRPMKITDIEQVLTVESLSFSKPWTKKSFEHELTDNIFAYYYVADNNEKIIGYAGMWIIIDEAHITNIAVHPSYRGLGIGEKLIYNLILEAIKLGANKMTLEVRETNILAQKLYSKLGFTKAGIRKGYYTDNNENAIIMWKNIVPNNTNYMTD